MKRVFFPKYTTGLNYYLIFKNDIFDENKYELRGEMDRQTFRLGQKVKIYIADADKAARTVDFYLADDVEYFQQS